MKLNMNKIKAQKIFANSFKVSVNNSYHIWYRKVFLRYRVDKNGTDG